MFLPIQKALEQDVTRVGVKAKLFAQLEQQLTLPFSLVISSEVYNSFLNHNNLEEQIVELFEHGDSPDKLIAGFTQLAQLFEQASFSPDVIAELRECFELAALDTSDLNSLSSQQQGSAVLVLRRSTDYNDTDVTCPGTIFTKESFSDFLRAVKSCMLSAFTPSSVIARRAQNVFSFSVAVIVSRMPTIQTCLESSLYFHKNNIIVQSYMGFPDRSNIVPKDTFTLSVDFLRIMEANVIEQTVVAVFDKVANQMQHRKYAPGGSSQTVPDQMILEVGRLTKKISTTLQSKELSAEFVANNDGEIICFDVVLAPRTGQTKKPSEEKSTQEIPNSQTTNEPLPTLSETLAGEQELASALISFLAKHKFSKYGPALDVVVRSLKNEVNLSTLKQGIMMAKELIEEAD